MSLKKKTFMLKKAYNDIFGSFEEIPIAAEFHDQNLTDYYIIFQEDFKKLNRLLTDFDEDGIPLISSYIDVEDGGKLHYYPISIGQFALAVFQSYLATKSDEKREHFLRIADYFVNTAIEDAKVGAYWLTDVPKPEFRVTKPWKSAFTQSRAISVLLRAYQLTSNDIYRDLAVRALEPYGFDINEGGVRVGDKGAYFYEEYVAAKPTRILDGGIFSLFGLYDMVRVEQHKESSAYEKSRALFGEGLTGLKHWLPKFDTGNWVYYNRCELDFYPQMDPCTIGYLRLVARQLDILHGITGDDYFSNYASRFRSYMSMKGYVHMYRNKWKALKQMNRL